MHELPSFSRVLHTCTIMFIIEFTKPDKILHLHYMYYVIWSKSADSPPQRMEKKINRKG